MEETLLKDQAHKMPKMRRRIQLEFAMIRILKAHKELSVKEVILETTRSVVVIFVRIPRKSSVQLKLCRNVGEVKGTTVRYLGVVNNNRKSSNDRASSSNVYPTNFLATVPQ